MAFTIGHEVTPSMRLAVSVATKLRLSNPENHWNFGNKIPRPKCFDCGTQLKCIGSKRCRSCAEKIKNKPKKEKHNWYKDGRTELHLLIRYSVEMENWRKTVFERDNYKCVKCNCTGYLEAHHKKMFKNIFDEFLSFYSQFSPLEEKEILFRLSKSYKDFWNVDNGETLCKKCHKDITWQKSKE